MTGVAIDLGNYVVVKVGRARPRAAASQSSDGAGERNTPFPQPAEFSSERATVCLILRHVAAEVKSAGKERYVRSRRTTS